LSTGNSVIARLLAGLEMQLVDWRIRDTILATVEIVSWLAAAVHASVRLCRRTVTVLAGTYEHRSVLVRTG